MQTCLVDDLDCCPQSNPECEREEVLNACVPASTGIDGLTSGVCRAVGNSLTTYTHVYEFECDRAIEARVARVDPDTLADLGGIAGADVTLRHADGANPVTLPALDITDPADRPAQCMRDDACVPQTQTCNTATRQCEARLTGLRAATGSTPEEPEGEDPGIFRSRVFTYCDPPGNDPVTRSYTVRVDPPDETGLPPVLYEVSASFRPLEQSGAEPLDLGDSKAFCVPDWGPPTTLKIVPDGEPLTLLTVGSDPYTCCNLDCLPTEPGLDPPPTPSSCGGAGSGESVPTVDVSTELRITPAQAELYLAADSPCVPPTTDSSGVVGVLRRVAECGQDGDDPTACVLEAVPGNATQERTYNVRIEPPTGSVLGSVDEVITLDNQQLNEIRIQLPQRQIVRGRVVLSSAICSVDEEDDADCGSEGAKVLAERLRMDPETEANTPGPYFHEVATFTDPEQGDGAYVLPLDPGVWVMTALPDRGTAGGPAVLTVLDLRGVAGEWLENFTLEPGILVTLDLNSFDLRSSVLPLDIGSWRFQGLLHPGRGEDVAPPERVLDLMAPGECLGDADSSQGCRIRRLVSGTSLTPTQVGQVRFTVRDVNAGAAARNCSNSDEETG